MASSLRWTSTDLQSLRDDGKTYEIVGGELYVSKQPNVYHQGACGALFAELRSWSKQTRLGISILALGLILADDDDVAPDVVWISNHRLAAALEADGKLHSAPELVVEVLSPGSTNEHRDREAKLKLYSRRGIGEYWIADWKLREIQVYRRKDARLVLSATLYEADVLTSPLLPDFTCKVSELFEDIPRG
jgi:Uma2 family endonuclease